MLPGKHMTPLLTVVKAEGILRQPKKVESPVKLAVQALEALVSSLDKWESFPHKRGNYNNGENK